MRLLSRSMGSQFTQFSSSFPCLTQNADEAARFESEIYSQI